MTEGYCLEYVKHQKTEDQEINPITEWGIELNSNNHNLWFMMSIVLNPQGKCKVWISL